MWAFDSAGAAVGVEYSGLQCGRRLMEPSLILGCAVSWGTLEQACRRSQWLQSAEYHLRLQASKLLLKCRLSRRLLAPTKTPAQTAALGPPATVKVWTGLDPLAGTNMAQLWNATLNQVGGCLQMSD